LYDWTWVPIRPWKAPGKGYWLLVRRSISKPDELAYYVCFGESGTTLEELVRVAGTRWAIEESFEEAKGQIGLDQYQVRRWAGRYRCITLVLLAQAFLVVTHCQAANKVAPEKRGLCIAKKD
jgi:SRSO17 transposase